MYGVILSRTGRLIILRQKESRFVDDANLLSLQSESYEMQSQQKLGFCRFRI